MLNPIYACFSRPVPSKAFVMVCMYSVLVMGVGCIFIINHWCGQMHVFEHTFRQTCSETVANFG